VVLNGAVPAAVGRCRLEDWNHNKIPDWSFKFDRGSVAAVLPEGDSVPVAVTGEIPEAARFTGTDVIRVADGMVTGAGRSAIAGAGTAASRLPRELRLHAASPNPFHGATRIRFDLPEASGVRLRVFDLRGRMARSATPATGPAAPMMHLHHGIPRPSCVLLMELPPDAPPAGNQPREAKTCTGKSHRSSV
jgi:hypothetical protein